MQQIERRAMAIVGGLGILAVAFGCSFEPSVLDQRSHSSEEVRKDEGSWEGEAAHATAVSLPDSHRAPVNVKTFGAVGDGRADDTAAVQAAIARLEPGDTLHFPSGTYRLSGDAKIPNLRFVKNLDDLTVSGEGPDKSRIVYFYRQSDTTPLFENSLMAFEAGIKRVRIVDLGLRYGISKAEVRSSYGGKINGIFLPVVDDLEIENVKVTGFNYSGLLIASNLLGGGRYSRNVEIKSSTFAENRVAGVEIGNVDGATIRDCLLYHNGLNGDGGTGYGFAGMASELPRNIWIVKNRVVRNVRKGIDFHNGKDVHILDNVVAESGLFGIAVAGGMEGVPGEAPGIAVIKGNHIVGMNRKTTQRTLELTSAGSFTYHDVITAIWIGRRHRRAVRDTPTNIAEFRIEGNIVDGLSETPVHLDDFVSDERFEAYPIMVASDLSDVRIVIEGNSLGGASAVSALLLSGGLALGPATDKLGGIVYELKRNTFQASVPGQSYRMRFANAKEVQVSGTRLAISDSGANQAKGGTRRSLVFLQGTYRTSRLIVEGMSGKDSNAKTLFALGGRRPSESVIRRNAVGN